MKPRMNQHAPDNRDRIRLLVAISSYGEGHLELLKRQLQHYQELPMKVDVVVCSNAPKQLGSGVEVVVGMPGKNPWTLPFAHKALFAQRADQYDLFIYSEDDIGVEAKNIRAFLDATAQLDADEIAGFLRYEVDANGKRRLAEPWGHYHWKPESVRRRGDYTVAEFTNEHAGFYLLTQCQLKRAIASGGYLRGPCVGRYSLPETAATDPYTNCGFRKVICISALDDFLVHHLPNRYINDLPVSLEAFQEQIQTLFAIRDGRHPARTLCEVEPKHWPSRWQKGYYEPPIPEWHSAVPAKASTILSIGCGWGHFEEKLKDRGAKITAIPLDSVIGAAAARRGIHVVHGTWAECLEKLSGQRFDCVLIKDLLHLQQDPETMAAQCSRLVAHSGSLILGGPNFARLPWLLKRVLRQGKFATLRNFESSGISACGPATFEKRLRSDGFKIEGIRWLHHAWNPGAPPDTGLALGRLTARDWILQAKRIRESDGN